MSILRHAKPVPPRLSGSMDQQFWKLKESNGEITEMDYVKMDFTKLISDILNRPMEPSNNEDNATPAIYFAWEDARYVYRKASEIAVRKAKDIIHKHTDSLVLIGYSFPTFNRDVDARILSLS